MVNTRKKRRIKPLVRVTVEYRYESSTIPDAVRMPMDNGTVGLYERRGPHPSFLAAMEILRNWPKEQPDGSYQYPYGVKKSRGL